MTDLDPVAYIDPFANTVQVMPIAMVNAYVPYAPHLNLQDAARVAAIRDVEAADNFLLSVQEDAQVLSIPYPIAEAMQLP